MHNNQKKKAMLVKAIVDEHYEANSHRGSLKDIYRRFVVKVYPMSVSTFYRLIEYAIRCDGFVGTGGNRQQRNREKGADGSGIAEGGVYLHNSPSEA